MRRFRFRRRSPRVLVIVVSGVERRLHPGDKLYLTQSSEWDAGDKKGKASVTVEYAWDGHKLVSHS